MSKFYSINSKLNKIKKDFLLRNPRNVLLFVEEDNLPIRVVKILCNKKESIISCYNEEEWQDLLNFYNEYDKRIFIQVKKVQPGEVAVASD